MKAVDLFAWGYNEAVATAADPDVEVGRVVQVDRGECDVVTAGGYVRVGSDSVRSQAEAAPVTGDWVQLVTRGGRLLIGRILPRHSVLRRRDPAERETEQVLAANFDIVGIVAGLDRPLPPGRFERLLVMARASGAEVLVLLTKADGQVGAAAAQAAAEGVRAIVGEVPVLLLSVRSGLGINELKARLGRGKTMVLVGASGSGKSSLLNAVAGADIVATSDVRPSDRRGRHTTIVRRLVLLPDNQGLMLDTPGIRSLGLTDAQDALRMVFGDILEHSQLCRFADCAHVTEPQCAVLAAVQRGEINPHRLERFLALQEEVQKQQIRASRQPRPTPRRR